MIHHDEPDAIALKQVEEKRAKVATLRDTVLGQVDLFGTYHHYALLEGLEASLNNYRDTSQDALLELGIIRREAERKMGEMLLQLPREQGHRTDLKGPTSSVSQTKFYSQVIADLGIGKDRANKWQWLAKLSAEQFEERLEAARSGGHLPSLDTLTWQARYLTSRQVQREMTQEKRTEDLTRIHRIADTAPSLSQFCQLVDRDVGPLADHHTRSAITRLTSRRYAEDLAVEREAEAREWQAQQELWQRQEDARQLVSCVRNLTQRTDLSEDALVVLVKDCQELHALTTAELEEAQQLLDFMIKSF
jgi:hypothetical protein